MNLSAIAILSIKGADYRCIISGISKNEAINYININNSFSYIKIGKEILMFEDIEIEKKFSLP